MLIITKRTLVLLLVLLITIGALVSLYFINIPMLLEFVKVFANILPTVLTQGGF